MDYTREEHLPCCNPYKGVSVLLCCQVDDISIAMLDPKIACCYIYARIGKKLELPSETKPRFIDEGLVHSFNNLDIIQTCDSSSFPA